MADNMMAAMAMFGLVAALSGAARGVRNPLDDYLDEISPAEFPEPERDESAAGPKSEGPDPPLNP